MRLHKLLSTKERIKILSSILYKNSEITITGTANEACVSKGLVSSFFKVLAREKIVNRRKKKFFIAHNVRTKALKILLNLDRIDDNIFRKFKFVRGAGIYGSFVKGENSEESDIDMWILVDKAGDEELAKLGNELNKKYGNVEAVYLTKDKLRALKEKDKVFYYSLIFGSINIYGEGIEQP